MNPTQDDFKGIITDKESIKRFILTPKTETGSAVFTLSMGDERYTYKVSYKESGWNGKPIFFVKVLTGADNENSYTYLGYLQDNGKTYKHSNKKQIGYEAPSAKFFRALIRRIFTQWLDLPDTVEFRHEGHCGRCNRPLTVPESVDTGFGPDCAALLGLEWAKKLNIKKSLKPLDEVLFTDKERAEKAKAKLRKEFGEFEDAQMESESDVRVKLAHELDAKAGVVDEDLEDIEGLFKTPEQKKRTKSQAIQESKMERKATQILSADIHIDKPESVPHATDKMNNDQFSDFLSNN